MKKVIIWISIIAVITILIIFLSDILIISRNEIIELLENNKQKDAVNIRVIEKEVGNAEENYTRETSKLNDIEYCKIIMDGEDDYNYINWVNSTEKKDVVVFLNEKIFNSSTLEVEPILKNYSLKALEYFKDKSLYSYKYECLENYNGIKCHVVRAFYENLAEENYEEVKVWIDIKTGDCMKYEYFVNEAISSRPEEPYSILEFTYEYDSVKIEEIKEPVESDYPDFKYTYLY